MRKSNRALNDQAAIESVLADSDVCRIGMYADGEVYIVPMNFGYILGDDGTLTLYFHCANEGRKLDMIRQNPEVCFEMDTAHRLIPGEGGKACGYSMNYASLIGVGRIGILKDKDERIHALTQIMRHYSDNDSFTFDETMLRLTTVLRLKARTYTGKHRTE